MIRVIKRYESRKLYDTEESRYISLDDIARWVREGQEVRVVDNATSADVSSQILTQIIHDEGKKGTSFLPTELLHELVRAGERAFSSGIEQVQGRVDRLVQASFDRIGPVRRAREEMSHLRERLSQLEQTLVSLETTSMGPSAPAVTSNGEVETVVGEEGESSAPKTRKSTTRKTSSRKTAAAKKTTTAKTTTAKTATAKKTTTAKTATAKTATAKKGTTRRTSKTTAAKSTTAKTATTRRRKSSGDDADVN